MAETKEHMKNRADANQEVYKYNSLMKKVWPVKNVDENTVKEAKSASPKKLSAHEENLRRLGAE